VKKKYWLVPVCATALMAQSQHFYSQSNVSGQLLLIRTVNLMAQAQAAANPAAKLGSFPEAGGAEREFHPSQRFIHERLERQLLERGRFSIAPHTITPSGPSLTVSPSSSSFGFAGLTHYDQRNANGGNQLSLEPPSPAVASGDGYVLEGVNNAVQVYTTAGVPLLPVVVSTNQLFGVSPSYNRATLVYGVYPTDMRVFYDATVDRWFVLQRSAAVNSAGSPLPQSEYLLAVSQTGDPTQNYNIYTYDTTDLGNFQCPCIADYPQIGADQYGFYISANLFNANSMSYVYYSNILAISKAGLASGATQPTVVKFEIPFFTGYEFAIQPASTPPGAANFLALGGAEYFVSSMMGVSDSNLAIWVVNNTSSLATTSPNLLLTQTTIPTQSYALQPTATQKNGPLTLANSYFPTGLLAGLDGGDIRVLSAVYAGGRLYVTLGTDVIDSLGDSLSGGAYFVISPDLRAGVLSGAALRQGYLVVDSNHLLRPTIAVNAQGNGAIVFTLVGPGYFPSAAYVPFSNFAPSGAIQVAGPGVYPEDGFTGYPNDGFPDAGVARWGDYSTAMVSTDGSIWMTTEYIPGSVRTSQANWGSYVMQYIP